MAGTGTSDNVGDVISDTKFRISSTHSSSVKSVGEVFDPTPNGSPRDPLVNTQFELLGGSVL